MLARSAGKTATARERDGKALASLVQELEARSQKYLQQCWKTLPSEPRHAVWAKLYAASQRLSVAARHAEVAEAVIEISSNLMACEALAVLQWEAGGKEFSFLASVGLTKRQRNALLSNAGEIAEEAGIGKVRIPGAEDAEDDFLTSLGMTAFVPLWHERKTKGAIVLFQLLPQKHELDSGDRELLEFLSAYGGPCLFGTQGSQGSLRQ